MGFTVEDGNIGYNGLAMATHRTLFAIDWLCEGRLYLHCSQHASHVLPNKSLPVLQRVRKTSVDELKEERAIAGRLIPS